MSTRSLLTGSALGLALALGTPAPAQAPGQKLAVGLGGALSGGAATFGVEMKQAVELAVEEKNGAGGILGARLVVEALDDEANAASGEAVARKLCANPAVLGVVGHVNSGSVWPRPPSTRGAAWR